MSLVNDMTPKPPSNFEIIEADTRLRHGQCVQIRTRVFVFGQNFPRCYPQIVEGPRRRDVFEVKVLVLDRD